MNFNPFWPCEYVEEGEREPGAVPSYLPGENPWVAEYAATRNLPQEATLGGAEQMYPEYRARMRKLPVAVFKQAEPAAPSAATPVAPNPAGGSLPPAGRGAAPPGGRGQGPSGRGQ
jgi:hypothetical protein